MKYSFVALALASSASASLQPRDAASILADLQTITDNTNALITELNGFSGGLVAALPVEAADSTLDDSIKSATANVGSDALSEDDSKSVLAAIDSLIPTIINGLNAFVSKEAEFKSAGVADVATADINDLQKDTSAYADALVAVAAPEVGAQATSARSCIVAAFSSAVAGSSASSCGGAVATSPTPTGSSPTGSSSTDSSSTGSSSTGSSSSDSTPTTTPTTSGDSTPTSTTTSSSGTPSATGNTAIKNAGGLMGAAAAAVFALAL